MSAPRDSNAECRKSDFLNSNHTEIHSWKPERSCEEYLKNWKDCKSFLGRFHHYYVYGDKQDCQPLRTGYECCIQWEQKQSLEAKEKLEELQHQEHIKRTRYPPLWESRTHPPENWNAPVQNSNTDAPRVS